jgi:sugar phosphate isomerase/epimerase
VVVLAGVREAGGAGGDAWRRTIDDLNKLGARLADQGLGFCYHTQNDVWRPVAGKLPAADLLERIDPGYCTIELDPSGALVTGADWKSLVREHPGRFFSMHLRDGIRPGQDVPYLPAVPLGAGDEDWPSAFEAAKLAGISRYLLEMEVETGHDVFEALHISLAYMETLGLLEGGGLRNVS